MDAEGLLLRQVHPTWVQNGQPTSQAFRPTPKDNGLLSVYQGGKIAPQAAWEHYTYELQCESAGVWALTVEECNAVNLPAHEDPAPFPEHAVIDFTGLKDKEIRDASKILKAKAVARGCLFDPHDGR